MPSKKDGLLYSIKGIWISLAFAILLTLFVIYSRFTSMKTIVFVAPEPRQPRCNFETFRYISRVTETGHISGSGTWKRTINGANKVNFARFYPRACRLAYGRWIPPKQLDTCVKRDNVKHVVIIADSNGRGYFRALHRLLNATERSGPGRCSPVKIIHQLTYDSYATPDVLIKHRCPCGGYCTVEFNPNMRHGCYVMQARCQLGTDIASPIFIEYITSWGTMDKRTQYTDKTGCQKRKNSTVEHLSNTTQSFLLGEYLSDPRPDILLIFSNTHDKFKLRQHSDNVDAFLRLVDQLVSPSTRLVWFSRHAEDVSKKPEPHRSAMFLEDGVKLTRLEWLDASNRIMYNKTRSRFVDTARVLLFPDLLEMSKPVMKELNRDGVHMKAEWYQLVMSFILQSLCDVECLDANCSDVELKHWMTMAQIGTLVGPD